MQSTLNRFLFLKNIEKWVKNELYKIFCTMMYWLPPYNIPCNFHFNNLNGMNEIFYCRHKFVQPYFENTIRKKVLKNPPCWNKKLENPHNFCKSTQNHIGNHME